MANIQACLLVLLGLFVLVHPSSGAIQFNQDGQLVDRKFHHRGGAAGHLVRRAPSTTNFSARIADHVRRSHARLQFLRGVTVSEFADPRSPVSIVPYEYAMSFQLGSPAQKFLAIADTGSDLIWVQCKPCTDCFKQPDALFDPSKSSTFSTLSCSSQFCQDLSPKSCDAQSKCAYQYGYGDLSSTTGTLALDTINLSGTSIPKVAVGCGTQNQGSLDSVDGLVGLGRGPLSLPSQLGSSVGHKFSYCLVPSTGASRSSPIIFGDSAVPSAKGLVYTPLVANSQFPTFYYVNLKDISVGGKQLNIPSSTFAINSSTGSGGVIFDSGTTITQFAWKGYDAVKKALQSSISYPQVDGSKFGLDLCFDVSAVSKPQFPAVTFNFDGADFPLPTENTFVAADQKAKTVCLAMAGTDPAFSIFGNIQQQGFQVIYDIEKSQLGWVASQC